MKHSILSVFLITIVVLIVPLVFTSDVSAQTPTPSASASPSTSATPSTSPSTSATPTSSATPIPTATPTPVASSLLSIPTKLTGSAWAPNFGWLNFGDGTLTYPAVTIDRTTGIFSGYGWSPNIGWIRMSPLLTGPSMAGDNYGVKAIASTTKAGWYDIKGWMRACSAYVSPSLSSCSSLEKTTTGSERGGWDGWFKMKDVAYDSNTQTFSGFAWGDLIGGWVNFSLFNNSVVPPNVVCSASVSTDHQTVTWSASVDNPTNPTDLYDYVWTGWFDTAGELFTSPLVSNVLTNSYTKTYISNAVRTVAAYVTVTQGGNTIGTCPASTTVGGTTPPYNPPDASFSARCTATLNNNNSIDWLATYFNGEPILPVSYRWNWGFTDDPSTSNNPVTNNLASNSVGRVTIEDLAHNSATSDYCSVAEVEDSCQLKVTYAGDKDSDVIVNAITGVEFPDTTTGVVNCDENITLKTRYDKKIWWTEGACPTNATYLDTTSYLQKIVYVGSDGLVTKEVCADWGDRLDGSDGDVQITNNLVKVDCGLVPCNYTTGSVISAPLARIRNTAGVEDVKVSDWGVFGSMAENYCDSKPRICIGSGITNCIESGDTDTVLRLANLDYSLSTVDKSLKFYFPDRCPGAGNISVFHRPAANGTTNNPYWEVILTGQFSQKSATLKLYFNDPSSSNR